MSLYVFQFPDNLLVLLSTHCSPPHADIHTADAVVLQPQPDTRLERPRLLDQQAHTILESRPGRHGDLVVVLRTEAAVLPSPFGEADNPPGHLGRVGDLEDEFMLPDGTVL